MSYRDSSALVKPYVQEWIPRSSVTLLEIGRFWIKLNRQR
jgi:hypothetical protein